MSNITGRLLNARRVKLGSVYIISGDVYEDVHGRFYDGEFIWTSAVVHEEGSIISTLNSIYEVESWAEDDRS